MMTNKYLQENYIQRISSVKEWKKFNKNTYLRFRINFSYKNGFDNARGYYFFNKIVSDFLNEDLCFYTTFLSSKEIVKNFYPKLQEFFIRHKLIIVMLPYSNLAGLKFPDEKSKEIFMLKYSDVFPEICIIL